MLALGLGSGSALVSSSLGILLIQVEQKIRNFQYE